MSKSCGMRSSNFNYKKTKLSRRKTMKQTKKKSKKNLNFLLEKHNSEKARSNNK